MCFWVPNLWASSSGYRLYGSGAAEGLEYPWRGVLGASNHSEYGIADSKPDPPKPQALTLPVVVLGCVCVWG